MTARCAGCGLGAHRYSTADPHHDYDAMACVNMLRGERDEALRLLRKAVVIVDGQPEGRRLALEIDAFLANRAGTLPLEGADT